MKTAISLTDISKRYRIYPGQWDRLVEALSFGRAQRGHDFWAVRNVNLEVDRGVSLGLLGRNGAGKSTLLKIISGVLRPTSGSVEVNGRLAALLQIGAGFNPEFTGRENVLINGLILGLSRKEIIRRFDEIEAFADIGEFMDQPVKTYSSGMRARLGFAVAVNVEPEILLVDETLSVGDSVFKQLGLQRMRELRESGTTIVFVSHSAGMVKSFCDEAVLLHKGKLLFRGETGETLDYYQTLLSSDVAQRKADALKPGETLDLESLRSAAASGEPEFKTNSRLPKLRSRSIRHGTGEVRIQHVEILNDQGMPTEWVDHGSTMTVRVHLQYMEDVEKSSLRIILRDGTGLDVFSTSTFREKKPLGERKKGEQVIVDFTFKVLLANGRYSVNASVSQAGNRHMDWVDVAATFEITRPRRSVQGIVQLPTEVEIHEPAASRRPDEPA